MTIRELIQFLEDSASRCRDGLDTNLKAICVKDCAGNDTVIFTTRCNIQMTKQTNCFLGTEYADLVIEEEDF